MSEWGDVFGRTKAASVALDRALSVRAAAVRAMRRRGLYLVDRMLAVHRLRRAAALLSAACPGATDLERANLDYLQTAVDLELTLLLCIRAARLSQAETVYRDLVTHHRTDEASRAAVPGLPAHVRSAGAGEVLEVVKPLAFALAPPVLVDYLAPALPELRTCAHGRLSATGSCRSCPDDQA